MERAERFRRIVLLSPEHIRLRESSAIVHCVAARAVVFKLIQCTCRRAIVFSVMCLRLNGVFRHALRGVFQVSCARMCACLCVRSAARRMGRVGSRLSFVAQRFAAGVEVVSGRFAFRRYCQAFRVNMSSRMDLFSSGITLVAKATRPRPLDPIQPWPPAGLPHCPPNATASVARQGLHGCCNRPASTPPAMCCRCN